MEEKAFNISLDKNPLISIKVIPGHFTTSNTHLNYYLDMSGLKSSTSVSRNVARELAIPYLSKTQVDTIVCLERTEVIGAYLAEELLKEGVSVMNSGSDIRIAYPVNSTSGKLIFQDNMLEWITDRNVILLESSISSGRTVNAAVECLMYYGGKLSGISALFVASNARTIFGINPLFTSDDIPGYKIFNPGDCEMCKAGKKLDALIGSEGYTKIK